MRLASIIEKQHATRRVILFIAVISTFLITTGATSYSARHIKLLKAEQVPKSHVCMVTDVVMEDRQTPVDIGNKKYYVCCKSCKDQLKKTPKLRRSKDPVSGHSVDKATAFIIRGPRDNMAIYFESEKSAVRYINR